MKNGAFDALKTIAGPGGYIDDPAGMTPYLSAWRGGWQGESPLVLLPSSTEQIAALVRHCARERIPIVPQGGNTGLVGGGVPRSGGDEVVLSLKRMNRIREIDAANFTLTAEAGCILQTVQERAREAGRLFPLSIASEGSCMTGGAVSTNAGGISVLRYGTMRDLVLGIEAVLPDGGVLNGLRSLRKDNTGYDLKQLFIGAEGTLGVVTAATLKLFPLPRQTVTAWIAVPHLDAALSLFSSLRADTGDQLSAFELISAASLELVLAHIPDTRNPCAAAAPYYLLAEISTAQEDDGLRDMVEKSLALALEKGEVLDAVLAGSLAQAKMFWHIREHISEAEKRTGRGVHFDISLPIARVPDFVEAADKSVEAVLPGARLVTFGHLGDGNLHYNICLPRDMTDASLHAAKERLKPIVYDAVYARGGSLSAEHGIGQERKDDLARYKSPEEIAAMRKIKSALDPLNIVNPGKIFS